MTKRYPVKNYLFAVDAGTNSMGHAATDLNYQLLRAKGKTLIGTRIFSEGQTSETTRAFREGRRLLKRKKLRLSLLYQKFAPALESVDPDFILRTKQSDLSDVDPKKKFKGSLLFPDLEHGDSSYSGKYGPYKSMAHLRYALMTEHRKFDVRLILIAFRNMLKKRGNFLSDAPVQAFVNHKFDLKQTLQQLQVVYYQEFNFNVFRLDKIDKVKDVLKTAVKFNQTKDDLLPLLINNTLDKNQTKQADKVIKEIIKVLLNNKVKVPNLFNQFDETKLTGDESTSLAFDDEDIDDELDTWRKLLSNNQLDILDLLNKWHNQLILSHLMPDGRGLSESRIQQYNVYHQQLQDYKKFLRTLNIDHVKARCQAHLTQLDADLQQKVAQNKATKKDHDLVEHYAQFVQSIQFKTLKNEFEIAYGCYTDNRNEKKVQQDLDPKHKYPKLKRLGQFEFYDAFNQLFEKYQLTDNPLVQQMQKLIDKQQLFIMQNGPKNAVIPHQVHQLEMEQIIENQKEFYPFLAEPNPNQMDQKKAKYSISELLAFRIPYYVGPLDTLSNQRKQGVNEHAWMTRKEDGLITPLNFDRKVDVPQSATNFISRATVSDTYLLEEPVLPDESLTYQTYKVLNELNLVRVNGQLLDPALKRDIFNELFKSTKTVSVKALETYLKAHTALLVNGGKISGLADEHHFNNGLGTYIDFKGIFGPLIDDPTKRSDFETMINWSTVYEDRHIYAEMLKKIKWLTSAQINALLKKRYRGWGRLSAKLLTRLPNENGESILQRMYNSNATFMTCVTNPQVKAEISQLNQQYIQDFQTPQEQIEHVLENAYTSPQNKKGIRQYFKVAFDYVETTGGAPKVFLLEYTRNSESNPKRTQSRYQQVQAFMKNNKNISKQLANELKAYQTPQGQLSDKLFLYFMQGGIDVYDGHALNLNYLNDYDIDHIVPQTYVKDDSMDNRVLTKRALNNIKQDRPAMKVFDNKVKMIWERMHKQGLLSKQKLDNLKFIPSSGAYNSHQQFGFIRRQLVETSQMLKLMTEITHALFPDSKIIQVPAKMNSQVRQTYGFIKNRNVNDYHHGFDAYLTLLNGMYLYERFPKLRSFFEYGEFQKVNLKQVKLNRLNLYYDILNRKDFSKIKNEPYYQTVMNYRKIMTTTAQRVYEYKKMLFTKETKSLPGNLFNATHYSARTNKKLIPVKDDKSVELYGGYSSQTTGYLMLVKLQAPDETYAKLVRVPAIQISRLNQLKAVDDAKYQDLLLQIAKQCPALSKAETSYPMQILDAKIPLGTLIIDGENRFYAASDNLAHVANQLVLSKESMQTLDKTWLTDHYDHWETNPQVAKRYDEVFQEIADVLTTKFGVLTFNGRGDEFNQIFDKFKTFDNQKKQNFLNDTLVNMHANGTHVSYSSYKLKGFKLEWGLLKKSFKLSKNVKIVHQSPAGLRVYYEQPFKK